MSALMIGKTSVGRANDPIFVIAEIGQNHQGNLETAKELILQAKKCGCDCVKFQKSCLPAKFTESALSRPYEGPNSWGKTYGEHKKFLEFNIEQFKELQQYANDIKILFTASAMDEVSLQQLLDLNVPFIKIGSGDTNNFALIENAAKSEVPLVISTGMQKMSTVRKVVNIMEMKRKSNFCLMHCISAYPTKDEDASLALIGLYQREFPTVVIGYSGHELGTLASKVAVLQGAKIIERHFTLDKFQRGSDHKCSLLPEELADLVNFAREYEKSPKRAKNFSVDDCISMFPGKDNEITIRLILKDVQIKEILECEKPCRNKLGKSVVYASHLPEGHKIIKEDLTAKVSHTLGIPAEALEVFVGQKLKCTVNFEDLLDEEHFL